MENGPNPGPFEKVSNQIETVWFSIELCISAQFSLVRIYFGLDIVAICLGGGGGFNMIEITNSTIPYWLATGADLSTGSAILNLINHCSYELQ